MPGVPLPSHHASLRPAPRDEARHQHHPAATSARGHTSQTTKRQQDCRCRRGSSNSETQGRGRRHDGDGVRARQAARSEDDGDHGRACVQHGGRAPLRRGDLGATRRRPDELEDRRVRLRAARCGVPGLLVGQRLDHRHHEVLPRGRRHRRARVEPQAADRPRREDLHQGRRRPRLLRHPGRRRGVRARADLAPAPPVLLLQLPGLVQRRDASRRSRSRRASSCPSTTRWTRS